MTINNISQSNLIRDVLNIVKSGKEITVSETKDKQVSILTLLQNFGQAIGVVNKTSQTMKNLESKYLENPLSSVLMGHILDNIVGMISTVPSESMDLLKMYWVLSHQIKMSCFYDQIPDSIEDGREDKRVERTKTDKLYNAVEMEDARLIYDYTSVLAQTTLEVSNKRINSNGNVGSKLIKIGKSCDHFYVLLSSVVSCHVISYSLVK